MSNNSGTPADTVTGAAAAILDAARAQRAAEPDPASMAALAAAVAEALDALFAINGNSGAQLNGRRLDAAFEQGEILDRHLRLARQAARNLAAELDRLDILPDQHADTDDSDTGDEASW